MKKFFSYFLIAGIALSFGFINPNSNASQKVLHVFNQTFKNAENVNWLTVENTYIATFVQNDIRTSITYDKNGNFLSSKRYYGEANLPFNVLLKVKEKYEGKTIGIVTELLQEDGIIYSINLEDTENLYVIESSSNANLHLRSKFKKQHTL